MTSQLPLLSVAPSSAPAGAAPIFAPAPSSATSTAAPCARAPRDPARGPAPHLLSATAATPPRALLAWLIDDILGPCYRALIPKLNVWQWADAGNVFLDEKATATPGYYNSAKTPYIRDPVETFTSTLYDEDHTMKSSRVGFTEAGLCILRYMPENLPGQALLALDSTEEAKKISEDRLQPTLPSASLTDDPDDVTKKVIRLRNMVIHVSGSYSPSIFRNKWLKFAFLDEVEVVEEIDGEGTLHDLARSRMADVPGAKLFTCSKPKRWRSKHHCEVVTGTLSAYLVPCPKCGTFQELSFDGSSPTHSLRIEDSIRAGEPPLSPPLGSYDPVRRLHAPFDPPRLGRFVFEHCRDMLGHWDLARVEAETYYECVTGCHLTNSEIKAAVRTGLGRWLQTNPRPSPRKRSRHIWDIHSPHEKLSLGHIARQFLEAQSDPAKLLHVVNNHFGLPFREKRSEIGDAHLLRCVEPYRRGECPFVPDIATTCADSQDLWWKYVTTAYRIVWDGDTANILGHERAVIRWGRATTRVDLLEMARMPFTLQTDPARQFTPASGFVDQGGHRNDEVLDLHLESFRDGAPFFSPIFGKGGIHVRARIWFSENAIHKGYRVRTFFCDDDSFKRSLYLGSIAQAHKIKEALAKGFVPAAAGCPARLWLPGLPGDKELRELLNELQAEKLDADGDWKTVRSLPNDYGDALKYCDAWFEYMIPHLRRRRAAELEATLAAPQTANPA